MGLLTVSFLRPSQVSGCAEVRIQISKVIAVCSSNCSTRSFGYQHLTLSSERLRVAVKNNTQHLQRSPGATVIWKSRWVSYSASSRYKVQLNALWCELKTETQGSAQGQREECVYSPIIKAAPWSLAFREATCETSKTNREISQRACERILMLV